MDAFESLQRWYMAQCDGVWEHQHGIQIYTNDGPGWSFWVSLTGTQLATREFQTCEQEHPTDWFHCRRRGEEFEATGGPSMLPTLIRIFLDWAHSPPQ